MSNSETVLSQGFGVLRFDAEGRCFGLVTAAKMQVRGVSDAQQLTAQSTDGNVVIDLKRVEQTKDNAPVARGTISVDGNITKIVGFRVECSDGGIGLGLTEAREVPMVDCSW